MIFWAGSSDRMSASSQEYNDTYVIQLEVTLATAFRIGPKDGDSKRDAEWVPSHYASTSMSRGMGKTDWIRTDSMGPYLCTFMASSSRQQRDG